jgi:hypothetical protein
MQALMVLPEAPVVFPPEELLFEGLDLLPHALTVRAAANETARTPVVMRRKLIIPSLDPTPVR